MPHMLASRVSSRLGDGAIRRHLGLILVVAVALIALGVAAMAAPSISARASVRFTGAVLLAAGLFQSALAVVGAEGKAPARSLAIGLANVGAGALFVAAPRAGILTLSLALAVAYVAVGLYKAVSAAHSRGPHWRWMSALGLLLAAFGALIAARWPASGIGTVARFVGLHLVAEGVTWLFIARQARRPGQPRVTITRVTAGRPAHARGEEPTAKR
jgi:membrane protein HdeD